MAALTDSLSIGRRFIALVGEAAASSDARPSAVAPGVRAQLEEEFRASFPEPSASALAMMELVRGS